MGDVFYFLISEPAHVHTTNGAHGQSPTLSPAQTQPLVNAFDRDGYVSYGQYPGPVVVGRREENHRAHSIDRRRSRDDRADNASPKRSRSLGPGRSRDGCTRLGKRKYEI